MLAVRHDVANFIESDLVKRTDSQSRRWVWRFNENARVLWVSFTHCLMYELSLHSLTM